MQARSASRPRIDCSVVIGGGGAGSRTKALAMPRTAAIRPASFASEPHASVAGRGKRIANAARPKPYPALEATLQNPRLMPRRRFIVEEVQAVGLFNRSR